GVLEALLGGQPGEPFAQRVDQRAYIAGPGRTHDRDQVGVRTRLAMLARRRATADARQCTRGAYDPAQREPVAALAERHRIVDGVAHGFCLTPRAQRAKIGRGVVTALTYDGQAWERLGGELEPHGAFRELRPAVVAGLVRGDQPKLAHLRLERVGALDRVDPLGQPDHLAHAAARLAGDEVLPHPGAQVAAGAHVERLASRVAEHVHAGPG